MGGHLGATAWRIVVTSFTPVLFVVIVKSSPLPDSAYRRRHMRTTERVVTFRAGGRSLVLASRAGGTDEPRRSSELADPSGPDIWRLEHCTQYQRRVYLGLIDSSRPGWQG
jgi:hypothetical protein